jgi:signal transduction histidine kinase
MARVNDARAATLFAFAADGSFNAYSPQNRVERLIAVGRVLLVTSALAAITLDRSQATAQTRAVAIVIGAYVLYSIATVVLAWRVKVWRNSARLAMHACDLTVSLVLISRDAGTSSPFFMFVVFSLVCARVRWRWVGAFHTGLFTLTAFMALGVWAALRPGSDFDVNRLIVRSVFLIVLTALLSHVGAYRQRVHRELQRLAEWPVIAAVEVEAPVRAMLEQAARIFVTPRILFLWRGPDETMRHVASWAADEFSWTREPPALLDPPVSTELTTAHFLCDDTTSPPCEVLASFPARLRTWRGQPLHPTLTARFGHRGVLSLRVTGTTHEGRLFLFDKRGMTSDDLMLGAIVAAQIAACLDQYYLRERLRGTAAVQARIGVARDLHDSVLQSLSGIGLQLGTLRRLRDVNAHAVEKYIVEMQETIIAEQRRLREFIQQLRPASLPEGPGINLAIRLDDLADRIRRQWNLLVEIRTDELASGLSARLEHEIYLIVQEALANAARHAQPSSIVATVAVAGAQTLITVTDDGQGFPFRGRYDHAALWAVDLGPRTLKERVAALGGSITIESWESGSTIEIDLPTNLDDALSANHWLSDSSGLSPSGTGKK